MMFKRVSTLLSACALAGVMVVMSGTQAQAAPMVVFNTTGDFGGGGNSITFGGIEGGLNTMTLTYAGTPNDLDLADGFTNANFGDIQMTTVGNYTGPVNTTFTLTIAQTEPTVGSSSAVTGSITGSFARVDATNFQLLFTTNATTIGTVGYFLSPFYFLVPPTSGANGGAVAGNTTIQGQVTYRDDRDVPVPEPATMILIGTGLLAAFRARRKSA